MDRWIVTAVDYGDSCDGKARVLGAFKSRDEAREYVCQDMNDWLDESDCEESNFNVDFDKMSIVPAEDGYNDCNRCEWNIEKIEL